MSTGKVFADAGSMSSDIAKGSDTVKSVFGILEWSVVSSLALWTNSVLHQSFQDCIGHPGLDEPLNRSVQ